ncbi:lysozyme inhibitor LprI family protein [Bradyrhizobium sp.]|uniref:lysozyme inhibitor LprI family protein n=1 Tax=Bradyrhizobium sp. TaxID=376 RepID=UPI003C75FC76
MRAILLALIAAQVGLMHPAGADTLESDQSLRDTLPLFESNRCARIRDPAGQLSCGDPALQAAGARLSRAVEDRLSRIADRRLAVEENVEWIKDRNLSCGIFPGQGLAGQDFQFVKACLLKETEERIAILTDPDFDCLATDTTAGLLICGDPALAIADKELNAHVLGLIAKMKQDEARAAFNEYAGWARARDRKCNLADKDNVPLAELSSSEACLADYIGRKTAEIVAAKGDPRKVFRRSPASPTPDADAVDLCVAQIHAANSCGDFLRVSRIIQIDTEVSADAALVTAEVEMKVLSPFTVCSPIAAACTGSCWDPVSGQAKPTPGSRESLLVAQRLRIEKSFAFSKTDSGNWRCNTGALQPIELGIALSGP